ncbi:hypothetical protein HNQ93_001289 [Hymenobacter luteus]|uniref:DUF2490 domain-containing protein n=2 Tax=Hymenobacter TaxID=89966 RepID=A0A7W9T0H9_9BACT|nr:MULTISPECIES: DUF2490 domain-containing protein [Hymenobacter]MBB4601350.1 hypothetical protein [Hymenobacter latericoloratus]MBB6058443.1 hypothetical protein [Hymenobacter luteus]
MKHLLPLLGFLLLLSQHATAQKQYVREQQTWLGVFNQTRFSDRWGTWTDLQLRLHDHYVRDLAQGLARVGLTYYLTDEVRLTAGYAYVHHFPEGTRTISQAEHRPWQQVQWFTKFPRARLMQWVRLDERFRRTIQGGNERTDGFNFNYRARYNAALFLPLTNKGFTPGGLQFLLNNEVMMNFGREIRLNYFDQNRLFAGLVYQLNPHAQLHGGYMHLFQQLPTGSSYRNQHTIRLFYFHNFDLRPTPPPVPPTPTTAP